MFYNGYSKKLENRFALFRILVHRKQERRDTQAAVFVIMYWIHETKKTAKDCVSWIQDAQIWSFEIVS